MNTDGRSGYCNLVFEMFGRNDLSLDIQFWADGDAGQCKNALPQGFWQSARPGIPVILGIDSDNRPGGRWFSLRLRQV